MEAIDNNNIPQGKRNMPFEMLDRFELESIEEYTECLEALTEQGILPEDAEEIVYSLISADVPRGLYHMDKGALAYCKSYFDEE